jgi:phasin family protein
MTKTRFQLPPRPAAAVGVDRWVIGESAVASSRQADTTMAPARGKPTETLASMKFPFMFGMAALLAAQRRNIEAMTAANRVVREGAQAVARRNFEILQQAIDGVSERLQAMGDPDCPRDRAMRQTEAVIKAYEDASANMRDMGAMIQHSNTEAMEVLGRRFTEAADEMKSLARYAARSFWDSETKPAPCGQQT